MTTITLPPDLERQLADEASRRGKTRPTPDRVGGGPIHKSMNGR
jgi:hypothetical protein